GLVNIPVRLFNATVPMTVRFHEFDRGTGRRVRHRRVVEQFEDMGRGPGAWEPRTRPERDTPEQEPAAEPGPPARAQRTLPATADEAGVAYQDVVKGYEVEPGRFVMLSPEELAELRPERSRTIDIQEFVNLDDIDP